MVYYGHKFMKKIGKWMTFFGFFVLKLQECEFIGNFVGYNKVRL